MASPPVRCDIDAVAPAVPVRAFDDLEQRLEACRRITLESIALQAETRFLASKLVEARAALRSLTA